MIRRLKQGIRAALALVLIMSLCPAVLAPRQAQAAADSVGSSFAVDGATYKILSLASTEAAGTVYLYAAQSIEQQSFDVPETVSSPNTNLSYTVKSMNYQAFAYDNTVTSSLSIPASVGVANAYGTLTSDETLVNLYHFSALTQITVETGNEYLSSDDDGVLYAQDGATLVAFPRASTVTDYEIDEAVSTVFNSAFRQNTTIQALSFPSSLERTGSTTDAISFNNGGIGAYACYGCSSLETLSFADGIDLQSIGTYAFYGCKKLSSLSIPPLVGATRKGDYYTDYATSAYINATSAAEQQKSFTSGYQGYWHDSDGPVKTAGIGARAFGACVSLESICFRAGNDTGAFAYWSRGSQVFYGCSALSAVLFEDEQAYWSDPNMAMQNKAGPTDYWVWDETTTSDVSCGLEEDPTLYYAIDYYASDSDAAATADDDEASARLARVEYKRETSIADISANNQSALSDSVASASLYADSDTTSYSDGDLSALDPQEVAEAAGYSASSTWCWVLSDGQQQRETLTQSCSAYLASATSLAAGRVVSEEITATQLMTDRHLSNDGTLDPVRYFNDTHSVYASTIYNAKSYLASGNECAFVYDSTGLDLSGIEVQTASGESIESYDLSFEAISDAGSGAVSYASQGSSVSGEGLYRVSFSSSSQGYADSLSLIILVKDHASSVTVEAQTGGTSAAYTAYQARYAYSASNAISGYSSLYQISVYEDDLPSAMIASGIAGLDDARINVLSDETSNGFLIEHEGTTEAYTRENDTAAAMAIWAYETFEEDRDDYGLGASSYPWGKSALLCSAEADFDSAAASALAYGMQAPVFFLDDDGTLSSSTLGCLQDFSSVIICGGTSVISAEVATTLQTSFGQSQTRLDADLGDACGFSLLVADMLLDAGSSSSAVAICDGRDPIDTIAALNFSGKVAGLTLCDTSIADSKRIVRYLHAMCDEVDDVRLYGRDSEVISSSSFDLETKLEELVWDYDADVDQTCAYAIGDTLVLQGIQYKIAKNNTIEPTGVIFDGTKGIAVGDRRVYDTTTYTISTLGSLSGATLTLSKSLYTYNGKKRKPKVKVVFGGLTLKASKNYVMSYKNNVTAGVGRVRVKGKGSYHGSQTVKFNIKPARVIKLKASSKKPGVLNLTWSNKLGKKAKVKGYLISLYKGKKLVKKIRCKKAAKHALTKKLAKNLRKKSLKVKICAWTKGTSGMLYGKASRAARVKIK